MEYFCNAAKEKRDQDHQHHDAQVQQLQAELGTRNQTLLVKQDEITQLNRQNAGFVSEIAEYRKRCHQLEQVLAKANQEVDQTRELRVLLCPSGTND